MPYFTQVAGHSATLVHGKKEKMVVIFGYSPQYGYLNEVQECYLGTREWQIVETAGFPVKGGYGHTSAYDPLTNLIYVYGGYVSETQITQVLTSRLYSYHPINREWRLLTSAPSARFFHTAVFVSGGLMIVFGGNMHNDTQHSDGTRCYSADTIAYDVTCDSWHQFSMPKEMTDLPRYGHTATVFEKSMYIYGGFDGQMLSDMSRYDQGRSSLLLLFIFSYLSYHSYSPSLILRTLYVTYITFLIEITIYFQQTAGCRFLTRFNFNQQL